jgi:eukaryotic-like serine/threonine-protein kinase
MEFTRPARPTRTLRFLAALAPVGVPSPMMPQASSSDFAVSGAVDLETDLAFQRYRLLASIGRGGMSEVFLAGWEHATGIHRLAVMKRLNLELCQDPTTVQMFLDEARLGLRLDHPNIVQTHDVGRFEGRPCILMEYLRGQPLHRVVQRAAEQGLLLPLELVVKVIVDVLDGLGAAHEALDYDGTPLNVVHRDISPHNLFLEYDGRVKILDFGIAKAAIQETHTRTGLIKGKFAYMAPEQARSEPVDHRADLWSVGVVFWELLTGTRLFKGPNEAAMLQATLTAAIPYPCGYRSDVPPVLEQILEGALTRNPANRYASAREMRSDLEHWLEGRGKHFGAALASYMDEAFAEERDEQQRFLRDLLARRETAPTSSGTVARVSSSSFAGLTHLAPLPPEVQPPGESAIEASLRRQQRLTIWVLLSLLALLFGLAIGVSMVIFRPLGQGLLRAPDPLPPLAALSISTPAPPTEPAALPAEFEAAPTPPAPLPALDRNDAIAPLAQLEAPAAARRPAPPPARVKSSRPAAALPSAAPSGLAQASHVDEGYLTLDTTPWSIVSVGGRVLGQTPIIRAPLPPGEVVLSLSNPERKIHSSYSVRIESGKISARRIGLE